MISRRSIGHVSVELRVNGELRFLTGMSQVGKNKQSAELLFAKSRGLGVLFHDFKGRLETSEELLPELEKRFRSGKLSFITFQLNAITASRVERYLREYRENGGHEHYGLPNRPLYGEGAGCSAFGASFLEVAGVLDPLYREKWTRLIRVPRAFVGDSKAGRKVSILKVLQCRAWATESEPHESVFFWDPDLMHQWVIATWDACRTSNDSNRASKKNARGLLLNRTEVVAPEEPIWRT